MLTVCQIYQNFINERSGFPGLGEEGNRHGRSKVIQLQSTSTNCIHYRSVMDNLHGNSSLDGTKVEISVGGCTTKGNGEERIYSLPKWISNYQECHPFSLCFGQKGVICVDLDRFTISNYNGLAIEFFLQMLLVWIIHLNYQLFLVHSQDTSVCLQVD